MVLSVLLIDNYDSFVYNLARYIEELGHKSEIIRNDAHSAQEILAREPQAIVLSPGPYGPTRTGVCLELLKSARETVPILGVCLGHQIIAKAYGGEIELTPPAHGKADTVHHDGTGLFATLPTPLKVGRYHSLKTTLKRHSCLQATATLSDGTIMAIAHRKAPIYGVQFHPESVLTEKGHRLLANFLNLAARHHNLPEQPFL